MEQSAFKCSFAFEDSMHKGSQDHIDRVMKYIKEIQGETQILNKQIEELKQNPKKFLKPFRDEIINKISQLQQENSRIKKLIENSKIPGFSQLNCKKITTQRSQKNSMINSFRNSIQRKPLDQLSNFDKNEIASTCQNQFTSQQQNIQNQTLRVLRSLGQRENILQSDIVQQLRTLLAQNELMEQQISQLTTNQVQDKKTNNDKKLKRISQIESYKKRMLKLLNKLRNRQYSMTEIIKAFKKIHQQTLQQLNNSNKVLHELQQAEISQQIDQKYAEVLQLEQRLEQINRQLSEMNDQKWLQEIKNELIKIVQKMGINFPKRQDNKEAIDELCSILIECYLSSKSNCGEKLALLKHYYEEEKKHNNTIILALKNQEQKLGRQIINMQMDK